MKSIFDNPTVRKAESWLILSTGIGVAIAIPLLLWQFPPYRFDSGEELKRIRSDYADIDEWLLHFVEREDRGPTVDEFPKEYLTRIRADRLHGDYYVLEDDGTVQGCIRFGDYGKDGFRISAETPSCSWYLDL